MFIETHKQMYIYKNIRLYELNDVLFSLSQSDSLTTLNSYISRLSNSRCKHIDIVVHVYVCFSMCMAISLGIVDNIVVPIFSSLT